MNKAQRSGLIFGVLLAAAVVLQGVSRAQLPTGGSAAAAYRAVYENLSGTLGRFRLDTTNNYYVFGSSRQYAGAVLFSSGSLVAQSTSATNAHAVFQVLNNAASLIMKVTQQGRVGIGVTLPTAALDVSGTINATAFTGDGSALAGIPGANSTTTWTAPQHYSNAVNLSSANANIVMGASVTIRGAVVHPVRVSTSLPNLTVPVANAIYSESLPKAWIIFSGTGTVAIQASFNVASITDNSAGDYTVTFAQAMASENYATITSVEITNSHTCNIKTRTTTAVTIRCVDAGSNPADINRVSLVVYGRQ
jgi:hypothetical protein